MIRLKTIILMLGVMSLVFVPASRSEAAIPIVWLIKEAVKKVVKAFDLMIQRLQNKSIALQNIQKELENQLSKLKLDQIAEWTEKHRKLFEDYYEELWKVKQVIATFQQVQHIIYTQEQLVDEYQRAWQLIAGSEYFTDEEEAYMASAYAQIISASLQHVDELLLVVQSFELQMTDGERLAVISRCGAALEDNYQALKSLNAHALRLRSIRSQEHQEIRQLRRLYQLSSP
ncbi:conjugal transfer protein TraI [Fulvivirga maritima]|uniref:conjugal transfer protein TraI n=1 Tax=Fulvivirga maritima TaxID=2904247 RepID=UPI001F237D6A|nr:conjugal transfer protein TraI [Fulvivirga maritima]UII29083.1 conjugal transfer protein TraI [Fulvivirga maritima]